MELSELEPLTLFMHSPRHEALNACVTDLEDKVGLR